MEETTPSVLLYYNGKHQVYFYTIMIETTPTIMEETTPSVLLYYNGRKQQQVYFYIIMEETTPSVLLYYF